MGCDNSKAYIAHLQSELQTSRAEARRNQEKLEKSKEVIKSLIKIRDNTLSQLKRFEERMDEEWVQEPEPVELSADDCCSIDTLSSHGFSS